MNSIISFKVRPETFRVRPIIDFYSYCEKLGQTIYVQGKGKVEKIKKKPELLSFLLVTQSRDEECLVVVEGDHVNQLRAFVSSFGRRYGRLRGSYA
ncbi:hypothetical protein QS257_19405 [Terrilactibacillus sp. S3-3]|nr:hypothetical protein QS257_19405 [Terrilactibacillus sp. S3-3]